MRGKFLIYTAVFLFLSSCGDPAGISNSTEIEKIPIVLTEQDLFKGNKIIAFLTNQEIKTQEAKELFLKGMDSYKNKSDLDSAEIYLRNSIMKQPTPQSYFELGNLFLDKKDYESALLAYGIAEQLDFEPFSKILYNKACVYSLMEKKELAGKHLEYALQAGYINLDHLNKDPDLDNIRGSWYFEEAVDRGLRGMSNSENLYWLQFKKQFAVVELPLELETQLSEKLMAELNFISYDYEKYIAEMRDEQFSREVSKGFYYFAKPYETENFTALVYIVKDEFMGEYAPLTYRMATFTPEGKLIDKKEIGGRQSFEEPILSASLKRNFIIDIELLNPVYEKDEDNYGYYENPMISSEVVGNMRYKINDKGMIVEESSTDVSMAE